MICNKAFIRAIIKGYRCRPQPAFAMDWKVQNDGNVCVFTIRVGYARGFRGTSRSGDRDTGVNWNTLPEQVRLKLIVHPSNELSCDFFDDSLNVTVISKDRPRMSFFTTLFEPLLNLPYHPDHIRIDIAQNELPTEIQQMLEHNGRIIFSGKF